MVVSTRSTEEISTSPNKEEKELQSRKRRKKNGYKAKELQGSSTPIVFRPVPALDPLNMGHIVSRIMSYLDVQSLKVAREVCSLFAEEGAKEILRKTYLHAIKCLPTGKSSNRVKKRCRKKLISFINLSGSSSISLRLGTRSLSEDTKSKIIYILQKLPEFAKRIKEYNFEGSHRHSEVADLARILRYLPNLQLLSTKDFNFPLALTAWAELQENSTDDSSSSSDTDDENNSEGEPKEKKNNMEMFLTKLENLKQLKVHDKLNVYEFSDYMPYHNRLKAITHLSLIPKLVQGEINNLSHFRDFLRVKTQWPICQLTWKVSVELEKSLVRQFLLTISGTLQHLDIDMKDLQSTEEAYWVDDWYLPIEMPQLKNLKLTGQDKISKMGLAVSLQMTQLEKLVIHSGFKNLQKWISDWECCPSASGRKLQSLSIQGLEIEGKLTIKDQILLNGSLWPQLKSLTIGQLSIPLLKNNVNLFKNWTNLEYLELNLSDIKSKDVKLFEKWMTGMDSPCVYQSGIILVSQEQEEKDDQNDSAPIFLRNLKKLKGLKFNHYCLPGDFVIYNCIQLLKNLEALHFNESHVSAKGIADLKKSFGDGRISILVDNKYV